MSYASFQNRWSGGFPLLLGRILRRLVPAVLLGAGISVLGQTAPSYAGRPFVVIARAPANDAVAGVISGFGRAQALGDGITFVAMSGVQASGVYAGRGGPLSLVAGVGSIPADGAAGLGFFHDGFAQGGAGTTVAFAMAAGVDRADAIYQVEGTGITPLLVSGSLIPRSGGKVANVLGEPFRVGDALAVIAAHRPPGGADDHRGVYRVKGGQLEAIADTVTAMAGWGTPDGFSSQLGFDGTVVAFWATRGPFTEDEGIFAEAGDGGVRVVARTGDSFPDGGTMKDFISPPFVSEGAVFFFAADEAGRMRLLKSASEGLTVLARDGDATTEGDVLGSVGQLGLVVEGGRVFFPALTPRGPGLYVIEGDQLRTVIPPGLGNLGGLRPAAIVLQDVAGDVVVLDVVDASNNRRLMANLATPAPPVVVASPSNQGVNPGTAIELVVTVLGDTPLSYRWQWSSPTGVVVRSTTDRLRLEPVTDADGGYYSVVITNAFGTATTPNFLLNVEAPPRIVAQPIDTVVEAGDPLRLTAGVVGGWPWTQFWSRDGIAVASESPVAGYYRSSASVEDAGRYRVTVSNAWGRVESTEVAVLVNPAAPNPAYGGRRFASIVSGTTAIPGTDLSFDTTSLNETSARVDGDRLIFSGGSATNPREGVFAWQGGAITRLVGAGIGLPNGLGAATGFTLVASAAGEPLTVFGYQTVDGFPQPVGVYQVDGPELKVLVDTTMEASGFASERFPIFFYGAVRAGGRVVFGTRINNQSALYRTTDAGPVEIVRSSRELPVVGTAAIQFQSLGFDGTNVAFVAATSGLQKMVALTLDPAGNLTKILARDEPIPGTSDTVRTFGNAWSVDGAVYLIVFSQTMARHVVAWRGGELRRVAGPGMPLRDGGTVQNIDASYLFAAGGRVFLSGALAVEGGSRRGVFAAGTEGIEAVLMIPKLDAQPVSQFFVAGAEADRVMVGVLFQRGGRALFANVETFGEPAPALLFRRSGPRTLQFTVPVGMLLEGTDRLGGPWRLVDGTGDPGIGIDPGTTAMFYRLRRP